MINNGHPLIEKFKGKYNLNIKHEWFEKEFLTKHSNHHTIENLENALFNLILITDIELICSSGSINQNIISLHNQYFKGPSLVQIKEIINIGENIEKKYKDTPHRTLKILFTDGKHHIVGIEHTRLSKISVNTTPGSKVILKNVLIKHGLLLLNDENIEYLGGKVESLVIMNQKIRETEEKSLIPEEWANQLGEIEKSSISDKF